MQIITDFLNELNASNSSNYKLEVLKKYNNEIIKEFLSLVYDKVKYSYGIKKVPEFQNNNETIDFNVIKNTFIALHNRDFTGNKAISVVQSLLNNKTPEITRIITCILDRDIHSGISTKQINKVHKKLITEFPYMRCSLMDKFKNIRFPAMIQIKADGTYRTFIKKGDSVQAFSRSGESYDHPKVYSALLNLPDGAYIGELICNEVEGTNSTEIRYKSNGLLNSLTPPENVTFYMWDYLTLEEFENGNSKTPYKERFEFVWRLTESLESNTLTVVRTRVIDNIEAANEYLNTWLKEGEEGAILKNCDAVFKNGTSTEQIKLKPEIEVEVRCIDFTEGNGKFKDTFGAIVFKTDDELIQGKVSGISDTERVEIFKNSSKYLNKVFTVKATALTKSEDSEIYALMHPRFNGFREDKDYTDTLDRVKNMGLKF
ncbi:Possible phage DNA ligase [Campylobacter phage CP220]|uniref:DNA ligase n=1 Tax=Campylobacter phage CP220 TaxID=2994044 RepID=D5GV25_9CAUD|nr:Possible phage DNA ligase [Campylobacter phage CP220]CBJ93842.1 Possible phage DNA ligase [Campylobacter phage CP220]